ncbi:11067_t:CDS:2 [Paraglomus brasilianum]|uniref:11067_t:CDS:1 n=1 Tax=Paraglomus brasilianum TaxID=144538 RepID=A0A9N9D0X9_9GLOM|nr:11067_t:CDS:2 [Paraglomus brasilianum]
MNITRDASPFRENSATTEDIVTTEESATEGPPNVLSESNVDEYFLDTSPERWNFLDFYRHRHASFDFTHSFKKEAFKLKKVLDTLRQSNSPEVRENACRLISKFKVKIHFLKASISNMGSRLVESNINFHDKEVICVMDLPLICDHRKNVFGVNDLWHNIETEFLDKVARLRSLRCRVIIKGKTQHMMENLAEETVVESCTIPAKRKKEEQEYVEADEQKEKEKVRDDSENEDLCTETEEQAAELEDLEVLKEIRKAVETVRNAPLGHLRHVFVACAYYIISKGLYLSFSNSPMYYLILDLRPPFTGIFEFRAADYMNESHLKVIGQRAKVAMSSRFDPPDPLPSKQLADLSSHMRAEGAAGLLTRLRIMMDKYSRRKRATLEQLLREEQSETHIRKVVDLPDNQMPIDLEGVDSGSEEIQWVFFVLDQCRRIICSEVLSTNLTERDVDINLINPFFDTLWEGLHLHYGEGESRASRYRRGSCGDHFDWLFACNSILPDDIRGVEMGVAENSGPDQVEDRNKPQGDFIKAAKTARDQLLQVIKIIKNKLNSERLPNIFMEGIKSLFAVAVHIVGYQVKAHVVYFLGGNVFAISEIGCARIPISLDRMHDALDMFRLVLRIKILLLRSKQILETLFEEAMILRSSTPTHAEAEPWIMAVLKTPEKSQKRVKKG